MNKKAKGVYVTWLWGFQELIGVKGLDHHLAGSKTLAIITAFGLPRFAFWLKELNFGESLACPLGGRRCKNWLCVSFNTVFILSYCSHPLILGLSSFAFHLLFPVTRIYALAKSSPRGLRAIFLIFLSSVYFGNGENAGNRSGGAGAPLPKRHGFLHPEIQKWEAGGSACL